MDDVSKHKTVKDKVWVIYNNGVYDITDYIAQHPGGNKILLGAGGDIGPYWDMYAQHKQPEMYKLLEKYRIGNILELPKKKESSKDDPYAKDPRRHPALIPSAEKPFNAEPPVSLLTQDFLTPNDLFFVRNHMPVPNVDIKDFKLDISIEGSKKSKVLTLDVLKKKFPSKTVATTLQCAGNRRSDMVDIKPVRGLNWGIAAISTAEWTGATLNDVLRYCGIDLDKVDCEHIQFEGMDAGPDGTTYGASIPIELARDLKNNIIVAYKMNGEDIPKDHGYPLRIIIPGVVGARQVKWLNKIVLSKDESFSHWQRRDYKGFNSSIDWHNVNFDTSQSIQFLPVQSAICEPENGQTLDDNEEVTVKGYAWSGGGRGIYRVDVSADGGKTWVSADIQPNGQSPYRSWAWTFWEVTVPIPKGHKGKVQLVCKACDSQYNVQPDSVEGIWNLRGCLSNAWHRITVNCPK
jgi:sulfite oxidase